MLDTLIYENSLIAQLPSVGRSSKVHYFFTGRSLRKAEFVAPPYHFMAYIYRARTIHMMTYTERSTYFLIARSCLHDFTTANYQVFSKNMLL